MTNRTEPPRWLGKLRGRSLDEVATRARQALAIALERVGALADGRELTNAELTQALSGRRFGPANDWTTLREHFRGDAHPCALAAWDDPMATARRLQAEYPEEAFALVRLAENVMAGKYQLLGHAALDFGSPVDWHYDPVLNRRAPRAHWSRIPFLDAGRVGDHKVIWELNRHRHLVTLALASQLTGDTRFAREAVAHLGAWITANPPKVGINWASSLEIAIRSVAWCWCLHLLRHSTVLSGPDLARALKVLLLGGRHIEAHLSTFYAPNTHLTGEALGLLYLGRAFPEFAEASRWEETGWRILTQELPRQVRPDGTYYEQSSFYQRYVADFYLHAALLGTRSVPPRAAALRERTGAVCAVLAALARADGSIPLLGDDDGGRLLPLTSTPLTDCRPTLAAASVILARPDLGPRDGAWWGEALLLIGPHASLPAAGPPAPPVSVVFPDGGLVIMRRCRHEDDLLVFDAGPHGTPRTNGTHSHADALSFDLTIAGVPMLVDPGTYSYVADPGMRDHMRRASTHNTLTVGPDGSAEPEGPFTWKRAADGRLANWCIAGLTARAEGYVGGFGERGDGVLHRRSVLQLAGLGWLLHDRVAAAGKQPATLHFHAGLGVAVRTVGGARAILEHGGTVLRLQLADDVTLELGEDWVSPLYGARARSPVLLATAPADPAGTIDILTLLLPGAAAAEAAVATRRTDAGWRIAVQLPDTEWNVQLGPGSGVSGTFHTDADVSWTCVGSSITSSGRIGGTAFAPVGFPDMEGGPGWVVLEKAGRSWERREGRLNNSEMVA